MCGAPSMGCRPVYTGCINREAPSTVPTPLGSARPAHTRTRFFMSWCGGRAAEAERGREMRLDKGDHRSLVLWATDCAEHVLPYFEEKYPKDDRPRKAVEAGRAWVRGEIALSEARAAAFAAHAAARDADQAAARAAARAAGHAAATAHVAGHAGHAATTKERDWQYRHLPKHLRPVAFPARGNS